MQKSKGIKIGKTASIILTKGAKIEAPVIKEPKVEELKKESQAPVNPVLFEEKKSITTPEEREELKNLRENIRDNYVPIYGKKEDTILEEEVN